MFGKSDPVLMPSVLSANLCFVKKYEGGKISSSSKYICAKRDSGSITLESRAKVGLTLVDATGTTGHFRRSRAQNGPGVRITCRKTQSMKARAVLWSLLF